MRQQLLPTFLAVEGAENFVPSSPELELGGPENVRLVVT
jgi:hypothetical protein